IAEGWDITERKEMAKELRRTSHYLETVIEASPEPIVALDTDGRVEIWNSAAEECFGWKKGEVMGEPLPIVPGDKHDEFEELTQRVLDGETISGVEIRRQRKDGSFIDLKLSTAPLRNSDGEIAGIMAVFEDVTERKRDEQQLQVLNRVLRHNLRNDLNVVLGYSEMLMNQASDREIRNEARRIKQTAEELTRLSNKAQHTEKTLRRKTHQNTDIVKVIEKKKREFESRYPEAEIKVDIPADEIYLSKQMEIAIDELIENAIEHNDNPEPRVEISVDTKKAEDEEIVEIHVRDNGTGIPSSERNVMQRGEETALTHGSGFGLWLVNWIVRNAGGELIFDDSYSEGSAITVRLRLKKSDV
ncbi:MAG: PAS domain S-box protein, partial [Halobacteria archaeon]|nr:PAS domain S-box protein [Halobacteria archaeon]